jgi:hypothetical protein
MGQLITRVQAYPGPVAKLSSENLAELACRRRRISGGSNRMRLTRRAVKNEKGLVGKQESEIG